MGFYFNTHSSHDRPIGKTQRTLKAIYVMGFVGGFVKEKKKPGKGVGVGGEDLGFFKEIDNG